MLEGEKSAEAASKRLRFGDQHLAESGNGIIDFRGHFEGCSWTGKYRGEKEKLLIFLILSIFRVGGGGAHSGFSHAGVFFCSYVIVFNASGVSPSHNLLVIAG